MVFASRIGAFVLVSLGAAGLSAPVFAGGVLPGNGGGPINLRLLASPTADDLLMSSEPYSGGDALERRFGVHDGALDFFSLRSDDGGNFKPLLRGGIGGGGLQLQMKW